MLGAQGNAQLFVAHYRRVTYAERCFKLCFKLLTELSWVYEFPHAHINIATRATGISTIQIDALSPICISSLLNLLNDGVRLCSFERHIHGVYLYR